MAEQKTPSPAARARNQQNVISLFCMLAGVAVFAWMIMTATGLKKTDSSVTALSDESSSAVEVQKSDDSVPKDENSSGTGEQLFSDDSSEEDPNKKTSDFSDACFIGDSRTVGLSYNSGKPLATFYCATGLNVSSALDENNIELDNGSMGNVKDALAQKQFKRIYIMFGINEVGWPYIDSFKEEYKELIEAVKTAQPDATVYVQSIIPVTASKDAEGMPFTNENIATFNQAIQEVCTSCGVTYLDVGAALADENGCLPEDAASDGIHMVKEYLVKWIEFLEQNT